MSFVESHKEIGRHPKTIRAAKLLGITVPQTVGHLHLLWHWVLEFAHDGDLSSFDNEEIAAGAMWQGGPDEFVEALCSCGKEARPGYLSRKNGLHVHDWKEYTGKRAGTPIPPSNLELWEDDISELVRAACEEIPGWEPDGRDRRVMAREIDRIGAQEIMQTIYALARHQEEALEHGQKRVYTDMRRTLGNWLTRVSTKNNPQPLRCEEITLPEWWDEN